ncbi:MAG: hypothetical protein JSU98_11730 [Gemmatimonadales bacterium]|jgi:hypothetical protein|nr:MAG: hypothetical protein JSU98_11730 [Gemmatimonadales bacterium]
MLAKRVIALPPAMDLRGRAALDPRVLESLPIASVAFPALRPLERHAALKHGSRVTLADAREFLNSRGVHSELRATFGTAYRRTQLRRAIDTFDEHLRGWMRHERQCARVAWLVPWWEDSEALLSRMYKALLQGGDYATFTGLHTLLRLPNAPRWTPFVSADSIRLARTLSEGSWVRLERALAKGAASIWLPSQARPWNSENPLLDALPTSWLYQFEPTPELGILIERGYKAGLYNVGHLAILDPAVRTVLSSQTVRSVLMAVALRLELNI